MSFFFHSSWGFLRFRRTHSWCNCCSCCTCWCCWWRWCRRASPPESQRSPGPRRSPTRAAATRSADHAGADPCHSSFGGGGRCTYQDVQLVVDVQALHVLVLLVEVVPASISSGESAKSRTSKVSDSSCSNSVRRTSMLLFMALPGPFYISRRSSWCSSTCCWRRWTCSWWSVCRRCTCWCCWWRWCRRASPPESQRSPGPRRSPTRAAPTRSAGRRCCCSWRYQAPSTSAAGAAGAGATAAGAAGGAARGRGGTAEHLLPGLDQVENLEGLRLQELQLPLEAGQRVRTGSSAHQRRLSISRYRPGTRSEEHTSELQSRGHLVCRLRL